MRKALPYLCGLPPWNGQPCTLTLYGIEQMLCVTRGPMNETPRNKKPSHLNGLQFSL